MGCLSLILLYLIDFLITTFFFWLLTLVLSAAGFAIVFTWGLAIVFWCVIKIIKLLL